MADLTTQVLIEIRNELRDFRLDVNQRLDQTNQRLDQTNLKVASLERRQTESELRIATEIVAVASAVHELKDAFLEERRLSARVDDHEQRIQALERDGKH